jgi:hypothetical protein
MPFMSNTEIAKVENILAKSENAKEKSKAMEKRAKDKGLAAAEGIGAAAVVGAVRGKMEASGQKFVVPGTDVDIQMLLGVGLIAGSTFKAFGKYSDDFFNAGLGISAAYAFQVGRQFGRTGKLALVAGDELSNALSGSGV